MYTKLCMHTGLGSLLCLWVPQCVLTVTVLGFGSGHKKKLMTCPCPKHWICGWLGNLTQISSKLSYSFKSWDLFCMEGGAGVSFAYYPDHSSRELALLITCPSSLIEYLLIYIISDPFYHTQTVWNGFPKEFSLQLFIQAELFLYQLCSLWSRASSSCPG